MSDKKKMKLYKPVGVQLEEHCVARAERKPLAQGRLESQTGVNPHMSVPPVFSVLNSSDQHQQISMVNPAVTEGPLPFCPLPKLDNDSAESMDGDLENREVRDIGGSFLGEEPLLRPSRIFEKEGKKKKKGSRVIPSRYMQYTSQPKGPMKATDRTILTKSSVTVSKDTTVKKSKHLNASAASHPGSAPNSGKKKSKSQFSTTPVARGSTSVTKTSTPTADGALLRPIDTSAIGQHHSGMSTPNSIQLSSHGDSFNRKEKSRTQNISTKVPKDRFKVEKMYERYIQWVFIDAKLQKAFKEQEKQVLSQLHALDLMTEEMDKKKADLDSELARMDHAEHLDETLDSQIDGLGPVTSEIQQFEQKYKSLAASLDTTRHQIAVKSVYIPSDQQTYENSLTSALRETEMLLGDASVMTRESTPKVTACATAVTVLDRTVESLGKEANRLLDILLNAEGLAAQESSLQIQAIQAKEQ